ncbi:MAG: YlbF family regulator [Verrucomicrobiales bacterium]|nr:YlbF family regulator [Verrucomicrobiales bacterium]
MIIIGEENSVRKIDLDEALRTLCAALLQNDRVQQAREVVETFLEDDEARELYAALTRKSEELHMKQHAGEDLTEEDVTDFNRLRDKAFSDDRVQAFSAARGALQEMEDRVVAYVEKTLELGRVPEEHEVLRQGSGGGCCSGNGGCGCH